MSREDIDAYDKFIFTLDWLLAVIRRYSCFLQFGLVYIDFETPQKLGETYGALHASHKLDEVAHCLRNSVRKTDLVARSGADFWILVPHVPAEEKLIDRIKEIVEAASKDGLQIVERDLSIFLFPQDSNELDNLPAERFLDHLKKHHTALAGHELKLPPRQ